MRHAIPVESFGPTGENMAGAVESCVHCGFCLPTCPTYLTLGEEMDSPRGRIFLMKSVLEGELELEAALPYIDNCLGCQACVTACPSGVEYGELITPFRALGEERRRRSLLDRLQRAVMLRTLPHPRRFRLAARGGAAVRPMRRLAPARARAMLELVPRRLPRSAPLPEHMAATGPVRARVALVAGCAQQVLRPSIGWATLRVLAANGVEVVVPRGQGCCGALALHSGATRQARALAQRNLVAFPADVDAIVTNAAGCGSGMHEYPLLFKGTEDEAAARAFADRVVDVSAFLAALGPLAPPPLPEPVTVAYHDACHLAHAQGIRRQPRDLLALVSNLTLVEPAEWEVCCGSAGTYNMEKPDTAGALGERKARNLAETGAEIAVTGNIGCLTQIETHLAPRPEPLRVLHTMELLDAAYRRERP
jgi:glycolate oxidase iron-sulfur subunit